MTIAALPITGDYSEDFSKQPAAQNKILLIHDQWDTSLFIALQQEGFEVIAVESPQKAWGVISKLRPHFIIIHLINPSRGDISTLQGCAVLAGSVPIIIAAPGSGSGAVIQALEQVAPVCPSFPLRPYGIGRMLH